MLSNFAKQYAPELALPPRRDSGTWMTAAQAGLPDEGNLYDTGGTPLNYIQQQGGQREFLLPQGAQLRGRGGSGEHDSPIGGGLAPMDLTTRPISTPRVPSQGPRFLGLPVDIPSQPARVGIAPPESPSPTSRSPNVSNPTQRPARGRTGNSGPPLTSNRATIAANNRAENGTLAEMLQNMGFQLPLFGGGRRPSSGSGLPLLDSGSEDMELRGFMNEQVPTTESPYNPDGTVRPVGSSWNGQANTVADALRGAGVRVTSVVRRGNARPGGHPVGNSIDIDPAHIDVARQTISRQFPGMPVEYIFIRGGEDLGNGVVSSGDHYHIDIGSAAGPRRQRQ